MYSRYTAFTTISKPCLELMSQIILTLSILCTILAQRGYLILKHKIQL